MSFSNNLLSYGKNLSCWEKKQNDAAKYMRYDLIMPGAVVEVVSLKENIFYNLKSGSISEIEKTLLQALANYIQKVHKVPNLRELDFFLRDQPSMPSWPTHFNIKFLESAMSFLELCFKQGETPHEWLQHKLATFDALKYQIETKNHDLIILKGSKQDAWVVEKNFDEWQKQMREMFNRPKLVLLYAINS